MDRIETADYLVRLLDRDNVDELREVQKLRYDFLLKDFDETKSDQNGLDDDGWDPYSDSILAVDKNNGRIIGTYRVSTLQTLQGHPFKSEEEFDISPLKDSPYGIAETGRAVVHGKHRTGGVIGLLWRGLFSYMQERDLRYLFGTCSLHGTDPDVHINCTSYLNQFCVSEEFPIRAACNAFEYGTVRDLSMSQAGVPGLLRAYLKIGSKVSQNGYIDYDFKSCDVMTVLDRLSMNGRYVRYFFG